MIEQRLDNTVLRLVHFKPTHIRHSLTRRKEDGEKNRIYKKPKNMICTNPLVSFTPLQIKQMISHGRVLVNGRKVKSSNFEIKPLDKVQIKGFIKKTDQSATCSNAKPLKKVEKVYHNHSKNKKSCLVLLKKGLNAVKMASKKKKKDQDAFKTWDRTERKDIFQGQSTRKAYVLPSDEVFTISNVGESTETSEKESLSNSKILIQNFRNTLVMKKLKEQDFIQNLEDRLSNTSSISEPNFQPETCQFLRSLRMKRFTEAFYTTYRNVFLFDRKNSISTESKNTFLTGKDRFNQTFLKPSTEEQVKVLFDSIGSDQSLYQL